MFLLILIFIFGLIVGSFLNCVIYRLEVDESPLSGSSYCPHCRHILRWYDLIPVLSFIFLRGQCRYCSEKISWQYPLVEITTGLLFILLLNYELRITNYELLNFEVILNLLFSILITCFLIIIFVYDLKHYIIPDKVIYPAIVVALSFNLLRSDLLGRTDLLLSALGAAGFFLFIVLISQGKWMGIGDIKLAFLMGLILGFPNILIALFFAFFTGAIIGVGLILSKKKTLKSEVPFAPFLIIGTFFALFWGQNFFEWYWYFFLFLLK